MRALIAIHNAALVLVCLGSSAWAEPRVLPGPSGSRILLERDSSLPLVRLQVVLRQGAGADPPGQEGRSAMLAHVPSRILGSAGQRTWLRRLSDLGAVGQTRLSYQLVSFSVTALRDKIDGAAALLAEHLLRPALRPQGAKEHGELSEAALRHELEESIEVDDDDDLARSCLRWALYEGHPLAHGVLGTRRSVNALSLEEVLRAYARAMRGPGVIFALDGDMDEGGAADLIRRHFSRLPGADLGGPGVIDGAAGLPPPPSGARVYVVDRPKGRMASVALGQRAPFWGSMGLAPLEVAVAIMGGTLRSDPVLPAEIGARVFLGRGLSSGMFWVRFQSRAAQVGVLLEQVLGHYRRWAQGDLSVEGFERARRYATARRAFQRETVAQRVEWSLAPLLLPLPAPLLDREVLFLTEDPMGVSRADIGRAMRAWLRPRDIQVCVIGGEEALEPGLARLRGVMGRHEVIDPGHL